MEACVKFALVVCMLGAQSDTSRTLGGVQYVGCAGPTRWHSVGFLYLRGSCSHMPMCLLRHTPLPPRNCVPRLPRWRTDAPHPPLLRAQRRWLCGKTAACVRARASSEYSSRRHSPNADQARDVTFPRDVATKTPLPPALTPWECAVNHTALHAHHMAMGAPVGAHRRAYDG